MKKILITGAAGFVGSHLVEHLLEDGVRLKDLRLFVLEGEPLTNLPNKKFDIFYGDIRNKKDVEKAMRGVSIVYHLAAKTIIPDGTYADYKDTNVDGTRNILTAAHKEKVKKLIYFSSIAVFGLPAWKGDMINIDENSPKEPSEPYGQTKFDAETMVIEKCREWKLPYVVIRPTTVYGPRDKAGIVQLYRAISKNIFFFIGNGKNKMDYVYVKDLVTAARLSEKSKIKNEDFIIGSGKYNTQEYIVSCITRSLGIKRKFIYIPRSPSLLLSYIVKWFSNIFHIRPLLFPERVRVLTANCYFNSSKAMQTLKYRPQYDIKHGMQLTGKWFVGKNESI